MSSKDRYLCRKRAAAFAVQSHASGLSQRFGEAVDHGDQLSASSGLRDEAVSVGAQYVDQSGRFMDGEEENFRFGRKASYFQGSLCATHHRHVDVKENDVRPEYEDLVDGFLAVLRLTADLKAMPIQKRADRDSRRWMIVSDKDCCWQFSSDKSLASHGKGGVPWVTRLFSDQPLVSYNRGNNGTPVWANPYGQNIDRGWNQIWWDRP